MNAAPPIPSVPEEVPVRATVAQAWRLLLTSPKSVVLPLLVVQLPVAIVLSALSLVVWLVAFEDEPFIALGDLTRETDARLAFSLVVLAAVQALFTQVARAATVIAVAGVAAGKPLRLADTLDPAFTRMGAILAQTVLYVSVVVLLTLSVIGVFILPYVAGRLGAGMEVMMLEKRSATSALRGSWRLLSGRVIRLLGVLVLTAIICAGPILAVFSLNLLIAGSRNAEVIIAAVLAVVEVLLISPVLALSTAAVTLFYLKAKEIDDGRRPA